MVGIAVLVAAVGVTAFAAGARFRDDVGGGISDVEFDRLMDACRSGVTQAGDCLGLVDGFVTDAERHGCDWRAVHSMLRAIDENLATYPTAAPELFPERVVDDVADDGYRHCFTFEE
jgi:hypothetical protein